MFWKVFCMHSALLQCFHFKAGKSNCKSDFVYPLHLKNTSWGVLRKINETSSQDTANKVPWRYRSLQHSCPKGYKQWVEVLSWSSFTSLFTMSLKLWCKISITLFPLTTLGCPLPSVPWISLEESGGGWLAPEPSPEAQPVSLSPWLLLAIDSLSCFVPNYRVQLKGGFYAFSA